MKNIKDFKKKILGEFEDFSELLKGYVVNSVDDQGNNILHYYVKNRNSINIDAEYFINQLTINGIDLNAVQTKSPCRSALHLAVFNKSKDIVKILVSKGANLDVIDENGNTPIWQAVMNFKNDDSFYIEYLLNQGANINKKNNYGMSALDLSKIIANYDSLQYFETRYPRYPR